MLNLLLNRKIVTVFGIIAFVLAQVETMLPPGNTRQIVSVFSLILTAVGRSIVPSGGNDDSDDNSNFTPRYA